MAAPRRTVGRKAPATQTQSIVQEPVVRPITHLTIRQWQDNPTLQARLRKLIEDPIFLLAHNTIINAAFPGCEPSSKADPGVSGEAMNGALADRYVHRSGMGYFPRMLKALADNKVTTLPANPYGDLLPEDE